MVLHSGERLILCRTPIRAAETVESRDDKLQSLQAMVAEKNLYLEEHPRAKVEVALRHLHRKAARLQISGWVRFAADGHTITLTVDANALEEASKLDGCYVLRTDLPSEQASMYTIHDCYIDLAMVEHAFRTAKTGHLEMRPIYLRKERRTRGYALVVMLAYRIVQEFANRWINFDCTVEEAIHNLSTLCAVPVNGKPMYYQIPEPTPDLKAIIDAAGVTLPTHLRYSGITVST